MAFVERKGDSFTGAGNGSGRAVAMAVAAEGAKVAVSDLGASWRGDGDDSADAFAAPAPIRSTCGKAVANLCARPIAPYPSSRQ